jgi:hypothetical protein
MFFCTWYFIVDMLSNAKFWVDTITDLEWGFPSGGLEVVVGCKFCQWK